MVEKIGKYEIKKLQGQGASGSVYLANDGFSNVDALTCPEVSKL